MTVKECYEKVGSDYEAVLKRLGSEDMLKRFSIKFLDIRVFSLCRRI